MKNSWGLAIIYTIDRFYLAIAKFNRFSQKRLEAEDCLLQFLILSL